MSEGIHIRVGKGRGRVGLYWFGGNPPFRIKKKSLSRSYFLHANLEPCQTYKKLDGRKQSNNICFPFVRALYVSFVIT